MALALGKERGNSMKLLILAILLSFTLSAQDFRGVEYVIKHGIKEKITPGASILVGTKDDVLFKEHFGRYTYDQNSRKVDDQSMFDMASVTKVMATTLCVMKLYDDGKIVLDDKVAKYIPEFAANGKENITLRNLLLHNSGMPAYYSPGNLTDEELIEKIYGVGLNYKTGEKMVYSCLHFVTLMKVTEAVTGKKMYQFYKETFTDPLGLKNTMFSPPADRKEDCVPTENGLQGEVHDPIAHTLKGYSGNAGLFSTVDDLSVLVRMLMNGGEYNGKRFFKDSTVKLFTTHAAENSTRALGWDTNSDGERSAGPLFSRTSYGHTGYTGTCLWVDPERELFTIFLTNRVYPDDKAAVGGLRIKAHNAVINAIENNPPAPEITSLFTDAQKNINFTIGTNSDKGKVLITEVYVNDKLFDKFSGEKAEEKYSIPADLGGNTFYAINKSESKESITSDKYIVHGLEHDVLLVDAIDNDASPEKQYHHSFAMLGTGFLGEHNFIVTNHNDVKDGNVNLANYKVVYWVAGEDNSSDEIMDKKELDIVTRYVNSGGKLVLSGTEVGWAFGRPEKGEELMAFYNKFLNAKFDGDNAESHVIKYVKDGTEFKFNTENSLYHTGFPDYFSALEGSKMFLTYGNGRGAGLVKRFDSGGVLVYLGFPVELLGNPFEIKTLLNIIFAEMNP